MTYRLFFLAVMAFSPLGTLAQTETASTEEEVALGWRFSDCMHYFLFAGEAAKAAGEKPSANLIRMQSASFAAAVALVGEEVYRAEVPARRKDFIGRFRVAATQGGIDTIDAECMTLVETKLESAAPKIQALAAKKQAEKAK